jgi:hypothetical protein
MIFRINNKIGQLLILWIVEEERIQDRDKEEI